MENEAISAEFPWYFATSRQVIKRYRRIIRIEYCAGIQADMYSDTIYIMTLIGRHIYRLRIISRDADRIVDKVINDLSMCAGQWIYLVNVPVTRYTDILSAGRATILRCYIESIVVGAIYMIRCTRDIIPYEIVRYILVLVFEIGPTPCEEMPWCEMASIPYGVLI